MHDICLIAVVWAYSVIGGYGQVMRMNTEYTWVPGYGPTLLGNILVDGQRIRALVDTGSSALYFTWKDWYEGVTHPGACSHLFTGCVRSPPPQGPITTLSYADGSSVGVQAKRGGVTIASSEVVSLIFGLVVSQQPPASRVPPINSIGLGRQTIPGYQSLMSQLRSRVQSETFALYLRRNPRTGQTVGELLLGGGDPSLYVGPLRYAQFRDPQEFAVTLDTLQVGSGIMTIGINGAAIVDTGSQLLFVPPLYMDGLKKEILAQASAAARTSIRCRDIPGLNTCMFDCAYRRFFPVLTLGLNRNGDIPLLINNKLYTHEIAGVCSLMVAPTPGDTWLLPDFVVVDNYFEFQPSQGRIGIARIRPH